MIILLAILSFTSASRAHNAPVMCYRNLGNNSFAAYACIGFECKFKLSCSSSSIEDLKNYDNFVPLTNLWTPMKLDLLHETKEFFESRGCKLTINAIHEGEEYCKVTISPKHNDALKLMDFKCRLY